MKKPFILLSLLAFLGCGDSPGSGIDRGTPVIELDAAERLQYCESLLADYDFECPDGSEFTPSTVTDCTESFVDVSEECMLTVGQTEDCFAAISADPCNWLDIFGQPVCRPLLAEECQDQTDL